MNENLYCRVCGFEYPIESPAWLDDETPSHEICVCCDVQFGYEDTDYASVHLYRGFWIKGGARWFSAGKKPRNWNLESQLMQIPTR